MIIDNGNGGFIEVTEAEIRDAVINHDILRIEEQNTALLRQLFLHAHSPIQVKPTLGIANVIFNPPATIVFWADGTKTVVKCGEYDIYDPEKGLAMAISKRALGGKGNYYNIFSKWLPKWEEKQKEETNVLAKLSSILKLTRPYPEELSHTCESCAYENESGDGNVCSLCISGDEDCWMEKQSEAGFSDIIRGLIGREAGLSKKDDDRCIDGVVDCGEEKQKTGIADRTCYRCKHTDVDIADSPCNNCVNTYSRPHFEKGDES